MTKASPSQPPQAPHLLKLTTSVSLATVRVVRSASRLAGIRAEDRGTPLRLVHHVRVGGGRSPDLESGVRAVVSIDCRLVAPSEPPRDIAAVECELVLDYVVQDRPLLESLTDNDHLAFAQTSGLYNAWPYLREFCQNASMRMCLPVEMVLPTLPPRVKPQPEDATKSPASSAKSRKTAAT